MSGKLLVQKVDRPRIDLDAGVLGSGRAHVGRAVLKFVRDVQLQTFGL